MDRRGSDGGDDVAGAARYGTSPESVSRLRALLALMRGQIRLVEHSLAQPVVDRAVAADRLGSLRMTTERLADVVDRVAAPPEGQPAAARSPEEAGSAAPGGAGASRCDVRLDFRHPHLRALIESGVLGSADSGDPGKVQRVVQLVFDRWSGLYAGGAKRVAGSRDQERRSGRDRRSGAVRLNCLLSYVAGTPLDRRSGRDRREQALAADLSPGAASGPTGQPGSPAALPAGGRSAHKLIRFVEARVARAPIGRTRPLRNGRPEGGREARIVRFPRHRADDGSPQAEAQSVGAVDRQSRPDQRDGN